MKILLILSSLFLFATGCSSDSKEDYVEARQEAQSEYDEEVAEAEEERDEALEDAEEEFQTEQKEEAHDYVESSEGVNVDKDEKNIDVIED